MTLEGRFTFKHESAAPPTAEQATPNTPFVSEPSSSMATPPTSYSSHGFQQQQHNNFMSFPKKEFACSPTGVGGGSGSGGPSSSGGLTDFYQPPAGSTFQAFGPPPPSSGNDFCEPSPGSGRSMYDHTDATGGHHVPPPPTSLAHPLALSTMRSIRRGHFTNQQNSSQELSRYVCYQLLQLYYTTDSLFWSISFQIFIDKNFGISTIIVNCYTSFNISILALQKCWWSSLINRPTNFL